MSRHIDFEGRRLKIRSTLLEHVNALYISYLDGPLQYH